MLKKRFLSAALSTLFFFTALTPASLAIERNDSHGLKMAH